MSTATIEMPSSASAQSTPSTVTVSASPPTTTVILADHSNHTGATLQQQPQHEEYSMSVEQRPTSIGMMVDAQGKNHPTVNYLSTTDQHGNSQIIKIISKGDDQQHHQLYDTQSLANHIQQQQQSQHPNATSTSSKVHVISNVTIVSRPTSQPTMSIVTSTQAKLLQSVNNHQTSGGYTYITKPPGLEGQTATVATPTITGKIVGLPFKPQTQQQQQLQQQQQPLTQHHTIVTKTTTSKAANSRNNVLSRMPVGQHAAGFMVARAPPSQPQSLPAVTVHMPQQQLPFISKQPPPPSLVQNVSSTKHTTKSAKNAAAMKMANQKVYPNQPLQPQQMQNVKQQPSQQQQQQQQPPQPQSHIIQTKGLKGKVVKQGIAFSQQQQQQQQQTQQFTTKQIQNAAISSNSKVLIHSRSSTASIATTTNGMFIQNVGGIQKVVKGAKYITQTSQQLASLPGSVGSVMLTQQQHQQLSAVIQQQQQQQQHQQIKLSNHHANPTQIQQQLYSISQQQPQNVAISSGGNNAIGGGNIKYVNAHGNVITPPKRSRTTSHHQAVVGGQPLMQTVSHTQLQYITTDGEKCLLTPNHDVGAVAAAAASTNTMTTTTTTTVTPSPMPYPGGRGIEDVAIMNGQPMSDEMMSARILQSFSQKTVYHAGNSAAPASQHSARVSSAVVSSSSPSSSIKPQHMYLASPGAAQEFNSTSVAGYQSASSNTSQNVHGRGGRHDTHVSQALAKAVPTNSKYGVDFYNVNDLIPLSSRDNQPEPDDIIGEEVRPAPVHTQDSKFHKLQVVLLDHTYAAVSTAIEVPPSTSASIVATPATVVALSAADTLTSSTAYAPAYVMVSSGAGAVMGSNNNSIISGTTATSHTVQPVPVASSVVGVIGDGVSTPVGVHAYPFHGVPVAPMGAVDDDANSAISTDSRRNNMDNDLGEETETAAEGEGDENAVTRCVCDLLHDDGYMIACDRCLTWQHVDCMNIDRQNIPDEYLCHLCQPRKVDRSKARSIQLIKKKEIQQATILSNGTVGNASNQSNVAAGIPLTSSTALLPERTNMHNTLGLPPSVTGVPPIGKKPKATTSRKAKDLVAFGGATAGKKKRNEMPRQNGKRREPKKTKRKSKLNSQSGDPSLAQSPGTLERNAANLRNWIEHYEQAITNHYSQDLRARLQAINKQLPHASTMLPILQNMGTLDFKCSTCPHAGGKILISTQNLEPNCPIVELRGKYMLGSNSKFGSNPAINKQFGRNTGPFIFYYRLPVDGTEICVDTRTYGNEARFVRRSCRPNAEFVHHIEKNSVHLYIVSLTTIKESTEITIRHDQNDILAAERLAAGETLPSTVVCACGLTKDCKFTPMVVTPPIVPKVANVYASKRLNGHIHPVEQEVAPSVAVPMQSPQPQILQPQPHILQTQPQLQPQILQQQSQQILPVLPTPVPPVPPSVQRKNSIVSLAKSNATRGRSTSSSCDSNMGLLSPISAATNCITAASMSSHAHDSGVYTSSSSPSISLPSPSRPTNLIVLPLDSPQPIVEPVVVQQKPSIEDQPMQRLIELPFAEPPKEPVTLPVEIQPLPLSQASPSTPLPPPAVVMAPSPLINNVAVATVKPPTPIKMDRSFSEDVTATIEAVITKPRESRRSISEDASSATPTTHDMSKMSREDRKIQAYMLAFEKMERSQARKQELKQQKSQTSSGSTNRRRTSSGGSPSPKRVKDEDSGESPSVTATPTTPVAKKSTRKKKRKTSKSYNQTSQQQQSSRRRRQRLRSAKITSGEESDDMLTSEESSHMLSPITPSPTQHLYRPLSSPGSGGGMDTGAVAAGLLLALAQSRSSPAEFEQQQQVLPPQQSPQQLTPLTPPAVPLSSACLLIEAAVGPLEQHSTSDDFKPPTPNCKTKTKKTIMNEWLNKSDNSDNMYSPPLQSAQPPMLEKLSEHHHYNHHIHVKPLDTLVQAASVICDYSQQQSVLSPKGYVMQQEEPQNLSMAAKKVEEMIRLTSSNECDGNGVNMVNCWNAANMNYDSGAYQPMDPYLPLHMQQQQHQATQQLQQQTHQTVPSPLPTPPLVCGSSVKKRWLRQAIEECTDDANAAAAALANANSQPSNGYSTPLKKRHLARQCSNIDLIEDQMSPMPDARLILDDDDDTTNNTPSPVQENVEILPDSSSQEDTKNKIEDDEIDIVSSPQPGDIQPIQVDDNLVKIEQGDEEKDVKVEDIEDSVSPMQCENVKDEDVKDDVLEKVDVKVLVPNENVVDIKPKSDEPYLFTPKAEDTVVVVVEKKEEKKPVMVDEFDIKPLAFLQDGEKSPVHEESKLKENFEPTSSGIPSSTNATDEVDNPDEIADIQKRLHSFHTENIMILQSRNKKKMKKRRAADDTDQSLSTPPPKISKSNSVCSSSSSSVSSTSSSSVTTTRRRKSRFDDDTRQPQGLKTPPPPPPPASLSTSQVEETTPQSGDIDADNNNSQKRRNSEPVKYPNTHYSFFSTNNAPTSVLQPQQQLSQSLLPQQPQPVVAPLPPMQHLPQPCMPSQSLMSTQPPPIVQQPNYSLSTLACGLPQPVPPPVLPPTNHIHYNNEFYVKSLQASTHAVLPPPSTHTNLSEYLDHSAKTNSAFVNNNSFMLPDQRQPPFYNVPPPSSFLVKSYSTLADPPVAMPSAASINLALTPSVAAAVAAAVNSSSAAQKIFTRTQSADPRLNPSLSVPEPAPTPKRKLSINEYRKRKQQTSTETPEPSTKSSDNTNSPSSTPVDSSNNSSLSVTPATTPEPTDDVSLVAKDVNHCSKMMGDQVSFNAEPTELELQQEGLSKRLKAFKSSHSTFASTTSICRPNAGNTRDLDNLNISSDVDIPPCSPPSSSYSSRSPSPSQSPSMTIIPLSPSSPTSPPPMTMSSDRLLPCRTTISSLEDVRSAAPSTEECQSTNNSVCSPIDSTCR